LFGKGPLFPKKSTLLLEEVTFLPKKFGPSHRENSFLFKELFFFLV
jgi:hypothetical protein